MSDLITYFSSVQELQEYLQHNNDPLLFIGAQSSTVLNFDKLRGQMKFAAWSNSANFLQQHISSVTVRGAVSWSELREYLQWDERDVMTYPTEQNASVLSGVATSATGEHAFGYGVLRDHLKMVKFVDATGQEHVLKHDVPLIESAFFSTETAKKLLERYQDSYAAYAAFKNAPFPRLEVETDLQVGFEGQLGVITEIELNTIPTSHSTFMFLKLPKWVDTLEPHMEIFASVQSFRQKVISCEFLDFASQQFLPRELVLNANGDVVVLEIDNNWLEFVVAELLLKLSSIDSNEIFELSATKFAKIRQTIPLMTNEYNAQHKIVKRGTDIQLLGVGLDNLMREYQLFSGLGIKYNLFGHFGDGHLHFNFLPYENQQEQVDFALAKLYKDVAKWGGSPFAEHGIGIIKQKFIRPFYAAPQFAMFRYLQSLFDPDNIFFPQGFMSIEE